MPARPGLRGARRPTTLGRPHKIYYGKWAIISTLQTRPGCRHLRNETISHPIWLHLPIALISGWQGGPTTSPLPTTTPAPQDATPAPLLTYPDSRLSGVILGPWTAPPRKNRSCSTASDASGQAVSLRFSPSHQIPYTSGVPAAKGHPGSRSGSGSWPIPSQTYGPGSSTASAQLPLNTTPSTAPLGIMPTGTQCRCPTKPNIKLPLPSVA